MGLEEVQSRLQQDRFFDEERGRGDGDRTALRRGLPKGAENGRRQSGVSLAGFRLQGRTTVRTH